MYTREFVRRVSDETHLSERLISEVLTASMKVVRESLKSGQQVRFPGFGVFYTRQQPPGKLKSISTGKVVAVLSVKEDSDLMIITKDGKIIRIESSQIRETGRSTQGVRLVRMEDEDRVAAASVLRESESVDDKNGTNGQNDLPLQ